MRWFLGILITTAACSGAPERKHDPLSGSIDGAPFEVLGSYAEVRDGVLYVTLTSTTSSCSAFPQPAASLLRVDLAMPPQIQSAGSFPLGSGETSPRLSVTWFTDAGGTLHQNSLIVETGTLEVQGVGASVAGSLAITSAQATLSGVFSAERCR